MRKKTLAILTLITGLLFTFPKKANAESPLALNLFPREPLYRTNMVDSDLFYSGVKFPADAVNLDKISETPINELLEYSSLAKTLPILAFGIRGRHPPRIIPKERISESLDRAEREKIWLSDKILNANLVASGLIKLPPKDTDADISYKTKLELFVNSPMIDDYASDGNRLYLTAGWVGKGSAKLDKDLLKKDVLSLTKSIKSPLDDHSFFADVYIVGKSPYSDQYLIFRIGVDNLLGNTQEKPNVHFSTTWEFPSIFKNLKMSPYFSSHVKIPTDKSGTEVLGQLGLKLWGESNRELDLYGEVKYAPKTDEPWKFFYGTKFSL